MLKQTVKPSGWTALRHTLGLRCKVSRIATMKVVVMMMMGTTVTLVTAVMKTPVKEQVMATMKVVTIATLVMAVMRMMTTRQSQQ